ncbi:MAG: flippase [Planctomycetota bacterium]
MNGRRGDEHDESLEVFGEAVRRNSRALTIAHLATRILRFPALLVLAPFLGREDFGRFVAAGALLEIVRLIHNFGTDEIVSRRVAARPDGMNRALGRILGLRLALAGVAMGVAAASGALVLGSDWVLVAIGALEFPIRALLECFYLPFRVRLQMHRVLGVAVSQTLVFVAGCFAAALGRWTLPWILAIGPVSAAVGCAHVGFIAARMGWLARPRLNKRWAIGLLRQSWPVGVTALLVLAYFRVDTLMLKNLVGDAETGDYGLAFRCSETLLILAGALATTFYPLLSAQAKQPERFRRTFLQVQPVIGRLALGSAFGLATLGALPLEKLLNDASSFGPSLWLLSWATACMFFNQFSAPALIALGEQTAVTRIAATNLALNVALNAWWIPIFGVPGACAATLLTEAANALWQRRALGRRLGAWPWLRPSMQGSLWVLGSLPVAWIASQGLAGWMVAAVIYGLVAIPMLREMRALWMKRGEGEAPETSGPKEVIESPKASVTTRSMTASKPTPHSRSLR